MGFNAVLKAGSLMEICNSCPRKCNKYRPDSPDEAVGGFCRMPSSPVLARAGIHYWEEPCISGENGSGTVFFSGCNLRCVFCQNNNISIGGFGKAVTEERLSEIFSELQAQGVSNINLVTPSHYTEVIARVLEKKPSVPVVYNSGGYDSVDSLRMLEGKIDIYMPDMKYADNIIARKYSAAPDYFEIAGAAIKEMYRQTGDYVIDDDGMMKSGVLIRHLVLPDNIDNSKKVIDRVSEFVRDKAVLFSLMSQFTPVEGCPPELQRRLTQKEYDEISEYLFSSGIEDGFMQELSSAKEEYIPDFDLSGI